jgi:hypothetical protein
MSGRARWNVNLAWDEPPYDFQLEAEDDDAEQAEEERRERDWHDLESRAREFVDTYSVAELMRCIARACE